MALRIVCIAGSGALGQTVAWLRPLLRRRLAAWAKSGVVERLSLVHTSVLLITAAVDPWLGAALAGTGTAVLGLVWRWLDEPATGHVGPVARGGYPNE